MTLDQATNLSKEVVLNQCRVKTSITALRVLLSLQHLAAADRTPTALREWSSRMILDLISRY
jgi:hypothetical protein